MSRCNEVRPVVTGTTAGIRLLRSVASWSALALTPLPALAQEPLSAIGWLSESVAMPVAIPPDAGALPLPEASGAPSEQVDVTVLGSGPDDGAGLNDGAEAGLTEPFWGSTATDEALHVLAAAPSGTIPALRQLLGAILTARLVPPADSAQTGALVLARIDRLLDLGALDQAAALAAAAGPTTPDLFRRSFDVALLTGNEDAACTRLRDAPAIAPALTTRIFCLARGGDWQAATLTFDTAVALGQVGGGDAAVLARFLDPDSDDDAEALERPETVTPLALRLFEAIGEPIPTYGLPLAFAHADLRSTSGWKTRIEAAERLAREDALPPERLRAIYLERRPAASGGVWDRAAAMQQLDAALVARDAAAVSQALVRAWAVMQQADLEMPLAALVARPAARIALSGPAAGIAFRLSLLDAAAAAGDPPAVATPEERFAAAIGAGRVPDAPPFGGLARAIAPAFADAAPPAPADLAEMLSQDRRGEAVLAALARIDEGVSGDLRRVTEGLVVLRLAGLDRVARQAAVELLLLDRRG